MRNSDTCVADVLSANLAFVTGQVPAEIEPCQARPVTMVQLRIHDTPGVTSVFLAQVCADHETEPRLSRYFASATPISAT